MIMTEQTTLPTSPNVPFVDEVEIFNHTFGKPNYYRAIIPEERITDFVINFIKEETEELAEAVQEKDIVSVLDAICDLLYVAVGNATMAFGLKDKLLPAYAEVQASNMSKVCTSVEEAEETVRVRAEQQGELCHFEKVGEYYIVYRTRDKKVMKSINYFSPNLKQFFTEEELSQIQ
jgi:NTP pyrophosphatase (non-canonical NTP hydrolase)